MYNAVAVPTIAPVAVSIMPHLEVAPSVAFGVKFGPKLEDMGMRLLELEVTVV